MKAPIAELGQKLDALRMMCMDMDRRLGLLEKFARAQAGAFKVAREHRDAVNVLVDEMGERLEALEALVPDGDDG